MIDNKERFDLLLRILARKNRNSVDENINSGGAISRGKGSIHRTLYVLSKLGFLCKKSYSDMMAALW